MNFVVSKLVQFLALLVIVELNVVCLQNTGSYSEKSHVGIQ